MEPYIERHQCAGYLLFLLLFLVMALFVRELWGVLLGFLIGMIRIGIPVFIARWTVEKYFEVNDPSLDEPPNLVNGQPKPNGTPFDIGALHGDRWPNGRRTPES